ncbi:unnamed protein product [Rotaria socialis]|uniref:Uncharacterized protein n=2 Tax=Rotaria socialis TaxID=392032 RepID=A0A817XE29_9BILA|nr:unnamed protein product [Rotaria socialis]
MNQQNSDFHSKSNNLPPRSQTLSKALRIRSSRPSTQSRILHGTLSSRSPASSNVVRQRPKSSSRKSAKSNRQEKHIHSSKLPFEIDKPPLPKKTSSGRKSALEVYELFEKQADATYRCTLCTHERKIIKQTGRGTANVRSHLIIHKLKNFAFASQEGQKILKINKKSTLQISATRKREIDNAVLNCITDGGLPFSLFNHEAVINLFDLLEPGYKPPDRRTISSRLLNQYQQHILDLKSLLPHIGPIAFASDVWKDVSGHHMISLSLHTFSVDFDFVSLPLSCHRFNEQKLSSNIQLFFEYEKERFGLGSRILTGITTDNGPDIKRAGSSGVLGRRYACLAHCLNLVVHHGTCVWNLPNLKRYPFDSMYEPIITSLIDDDDDEITNDILFDPLMMSIGGVADSVGIADQQSAEYFICATDANVPSEKPMNHEDVFNLLIKIHRLIHKVRSFVSMVRSINPLQRFIYERLGPNKGGFILDVKVAAFLDPLFHSDLIPYANDYETTKQLIMEFMQQVDLVAHDASAVSPTTESRNSSSTTNTAPIMLYKANFMNMTRRKASQPLYIQPLSVDLEMATFLILIRDYESTDFQIFWRNHTPVLPRLSQVVR